MIYRELNQIRLILFIIVIKIFYLK